MRVLEVFEKAGLKPRPGQVEAAEALAGVEGDALLVAPTGFGKTLAVLSALRSSGRLPVLWLVRSLELGSRISGDALRLDLKPFIAAGRARSCSVKTDDPEEYCLINRSRCPFFQNLKEGVPDLFYTSWEEIPSHLCRYYAQDFYIAAADVVVQNYRRRVVGSYRAVVVDEAHNLLKPNIVEIKGLGEALDALDALNPELGEKIRGIINKGVASIDLDVIEETLIVYREEFAKGSFMARRLLPLVRFLKAASRGIVYREEGKVMVALPPWRPSIGPRIYLSATIPKPIEDLFQAAVIRVPSEPRKALVVGDVTTKYGEETIWGYMKLLSSLKKRHKRILAFATDRIIVKLVSVIDFLDEKPPDDWRGLAMFNVFGRFSEGVDLPADAVVMVGAPFLPPDVTERLRKYYYRMGIDPDNARWIPMVTATLQAIGRATRSPEASPEIILADYRFKKFAKYFEPVLHLQDS
ncbi:MAG: helicase C-terminal domain-containing protein [Infirmifilum sp.]|uniref:helicase C-terminal domain-containing protein n=1 Tax=Infirmifilum TaxID=2856573 RepID=UPI002353B605